MSSLIFFTDEEQALVATDTLGTTPDGEPAFFTTKAFVLPHLHMIMCGTGVSGFLGKWFVRVNDKMVVRGIDNLDHHTPNALSEIWHNLRDEYRFPQDISTTIYHFGFSEHDGLMHTYVYRAASDFTSEILGYGTGVKPPCKIPANPEFPKDIKRIMDEQRSLQKSLPENQRVYIGGRIQVHHLTRAGCIIYTEGQFEDFDLTENRIFENYGSQGGPS